MQEARTYFGIPVADGKIYAIGGDEGSETGNVMTGRDLTYHVLNVTEAYDPTTNSWATKTAAPFKVVGSASAVVDNKIYVLGENSSSSSSYQFVVQIYDPTSDSWSIGSPAP